MVGLVSEGEPDEHFGGEHDEDEEADPAMDHQSVEHRLPVLMGAKVTTISITR